MTLTNHDQKTWRETLLFVLIFPFFVEKIKDIMKGRSKPSLEERLRGEWRRHNLAIDPRAEDVYVEKHIRQSSGKELERRRA
jgi:hypothetical protein